MKKQYLILVGTLLLCLAAAGCGQKKETPAVEVQVTATPAPTVTVAPTEGALVEMQKSENADIRNKIGEKTASSSQIVLVNNTGDDIAALYVRATIDDDDEWGEELMKGQFVLKNGEKALYYFDPDKMNTADSSGSAFDIRITYTDEEKNECFFRKLPLKTIKQITLCMDGTGEASIPYAKYLSGSSKVETSTLNEVKRRLGMMDSEDDEEEDEQQTSDAEPTLAPTDTPEPTQTPEEPSDDGDEVDDPNISAAESCIGKSLDELIAQCGEPSGSQYEEEPETGETGYHYYDNFTVSTTVDEDGNEVVAGVW